MINMEYGIAGLTPPSTPDKTLMWLQMGNAALDAYGTYHKYAQARANPDYGDGGNTWGVDSGFTQYEPVV